MKSCFSQCYTRVFTRITSRRGVICAQWILPVRIFSIGTLFLHMGWLYFHPPQFYSTFLIIFHITIVLILLNECCRSASYHLTIHELGLNEDDIYNSPPWQP